jgi:hypothetical protein
VLEPLGISDYLIEVADYYVALAENLRRRFAIISDKELKRDPAAQLAQLKASEAELEQLKQQLPADANPMLAHFLQRMSLTKALEFLDENAGLRASQ